MANPLEQEIIIVQNHGMARWLSLQIAEKTGIAANFKFEFPSERIWELIRSIYPDTPRRLPEEIDAMTWAIMSVLNENKSHSEFDLLWQYVSEKNPEREELRLWKLSQRIARVFDQYLIYRPAMIREWEKGNLATDYRDERWQSVLWRELVTRWEASFPHKAVHRAALLNRMNKTLDSGDIGTDQLPQRLTVFAVSSMPPPYLKSYLRLSRLIEVDIYLPHPWDQNIPEQDHELRISFDRTGRNHWEILQDTISQLGIKADMHEVQGPVPGQEESVLGALQTNITTGKEPDQQGPFRNNVQVHSCHSPRREVEVLYDQLLSYFENDHTLHPSDVLVLSPDLETYTPEINAIFGREEEGRPKIPYHIAEQNRYQSEEVRQTISRLLKLLESRFKLSEVLDLLDSAPVQEAFELNDEHLNKIEKWLSDNRIRWGIDDHFKAGMDLPTSRRFTWRAGHDRMIAGYAMKEQGDQLFNGVYPYEDIQQSDDILLAGRFSHFLNELFELYKSVQSSYTLKGWSDLLNKRISTFIPDREEYYGASGRVMDMVTDLEEQSVLSGFEEAVSYRTISSYLIDQIESQKTGGGRTGQGVNFSSMIPMRNIPARVICLLGMNDGAFPRSKISAAFDLISLSPQKGDRSHSDEDRQLFMHAILSAHDRIHISYVGQSNRHDNDLPPSVVVRELIDYLVRDFEMKEEEILTRHRLHSFSPAYFSAEEDEALFSYSQKDRHVAEKLTGQVEMKHTFIKKELPVPEEEFKNVTVNELISFFQHPSQYLLQQRFGIYLHDREMLDDDSEDFELGGLEGYQLGDELLNRYLREQPLDSYKQVAEATGLLPEGWPGEQAYSKKLREIVDFGSRLKNVLNDARYEPIDIDLPIDDFRITGRLDELYKEFMLQYRYGAARAKYKIAFWIRHLLYLQAKQEHMPAESRFYHLDKNRDLCYLALNDIEDPVAELRNLMGLYWTGMTAGLDFFPNSSMAYAEGKLCEGKEHNEALNKAKKKWKNRYVDYDFEGDDPYNKLCFGNTKPLLSKEFPKLSIDIWRGYLEQVQEVKL